MVDIRARYPTHDRRRINMGEESEIIYWCKLLSTSKERLIEAVNKVGESVEAVRRELKDST